MKRIITLKVLLYIFLCTSHHQIHSQPKVFQVAAIQLNSRDVGNFSSMEALAFKAKQQGVELVIFPEGSVFGWLNPAVFTEATPIPGKYSDKFSAIAKNLNIWLAVGLAEQGPKAGPGSLPNAYQAYDSGILINPLGDIVLHHRKYNVLLNAFDPLACKSILNEEKCNYIQGPLSDIKTVQTPFGKTSLLVCSDAYTYAPATALSVLKTMEPDFVIVPWGITAGSQSDCGTNGFNASDFAVETAEYLNTAFVIGSNGIGPRNYGKYLPSYYCGTSGYSTPAGEEKEATDPTSTITFFSISMHYDAKAGPIWDEENAKNKCPVVCASHDSQWNGQWTTTVPSQMSVCGCVK